MLNYGFGIVGVTKIVVEVGRNQNLFLLIIIYN